MAEKFPPNSTPIEKNADLLDLELAKTNNHFQDVDIEKLFITGRLKNRERVTEKCGNLIALCELYDIKPHMMGIEGTVPVVLVDIHPNRNSSEGGKFGEIMYRDYAVVMEKGKPKTEDADRIIADFDLTVWGVPAEKRVSISEEITWEVKI